MTGLRRGKGNALKRDRRRNNGGGGEKEGGVKDGGIKKEIKREERGIEIEARAPSIFRFPPDPSPEGQG